MKQQSENCRLIMKNKQRKDFETEEDSIFERHKKINLFNLLKECCKRKRESL